MKKVITLLCQLAILMLFYFFIWGDTIFLVSVGAIIVQSVLSLKFTGWVSAFAYPTTYLIASLYDTPVYGVPNNLYVYWYLSYIAITILVFVIDLVIKNRQETSK